MAALQKVALGVPPDGVGGDDTRTGFSRANANVDVLNSQLALSSATTITGSQGLTVDHIGKRVNVSLPKGGIIWMPRPSSAPADSVILIRNIGAYVVTLAPLDASDVVAQTKLNPGEALLSDTDGAHTWGALMRGRAGGDNEVINGTLTVSSITTSKADLLLSYASPKLYLIDTAQPGAAGKYRLVSDSGSLLLQRNTAAAGDFSSLSAPVAFGVDDVAAFSKRPTWAGATPWDSGNLNPAAYLLASGATPVTGKFVSAAAYSTLSGAGSFHVMADLGTAFANFGGTATAAVQMDCQNDGSGYYGLRWTHWGSRHIAGIAAYAGGSAATVPSIVFSFAANVGAFQFNANGSAVFAGALTQNSDYRIKKNVVEIDPEVALDAVLGSRPIEYDRADYEDGERHVGFIAHELQVQLPLLVTGTRDGVKPAMHDLSAGPAKPGKMVADLQGVNYVGGVPYLFAAIRALKSQLDRAVSRISVLEGPDVNHR
ncbi:tail fiber domain-containing protein [Burkholderia sp. R-69980]|nr:tail fiber domain-containing protein [Burkholderia sp. R-69980]